MFPFGNKICQKKYTLLSCKQSQEYANYDNCSLVCNNQTKKSVNLDGYVTSYSQNNFKPCIYKITNKTTGLCYIGQTTQCFTLRWYQHFFQSGESKFHEEIKRSKSTDWIFEVIEVLDQDKITKKDLDQREMFWIIFYNSINNGYNTAKFNL